MGNFTKQNLSELEAREAEEMNKIISPRFPDEERIDYRM